MKNALIGVFAGISVISLGYIVYDSFIKEDKIQLKECNKEELCDECICNNDDILEDDDVIINNNAVYTKDGKIYKLDVYNIVNLETGKIELENQSIKLEKRDSVLYANGKEIGYVDELYVTDKYILMGTAAQNGTDFVGAIMANGKNIDLSNNKTIGDFQAHEIYLTDTGEIVAIGADFCGIECNPKLEILKFTYNNGDLKLTKTKK